MFRVSSIRRQQRRVPENFRMPILEELKRQTVWDTFLSSWGEERENLRV